MKSLEVVDTEKFKLNDVEIPTLKDDEVLVKVSYCGICGSDLPRYFEGAVHNFPQVLGHEFSGVIDSVGASVNTLTKGQRVTAAPLVPCHTCDQCLSGNPAMCPNYSFIGSRRPGAMAEYVSVPAQNIVVLDDAVDLEVAAMIEPLTVALHGLDQATLKSYERYLILGAGTIGLMTLLAIKHLGKGHITVVDINDNKLDIAKECGADVVLNSMNTDLNEYFKSHDKATVIIETAGSSITQVQAVELSGKKSQIVYMGTSTRDVVFKPEVFELILRNELSIYGTWMSYSAPFPGREWLAAEAIVKEEKELLKRLITHNYTLENAKDAFEKVVDRNDTVVKVMFNMEDKHE